MNARKRFRISSSIAVFTFGIVIVLSIIFTFFVGFTSELASNVKALLFSTLAIIFVVSLIFFLIGIIKMNRNRRERKRLLEKQIADFIKNFSGKIREIKNRIDRNFNDARIEWFKTNMAFRSLIDNILSDIRFGQDLNYRKDNNSDSYLQEYFFDFVNNNSFTIDSVSEFYGFKEIKTYEKFKNKIKYHNYSADKQKFLEYCFAANYFMAYILKKQFNLMPVKDTIQTIEEIHSNLEKNVNFMVNSKNYNGKIENIFSYVKKQKFYDLFDKFNDFNTLEKLFKLVFFIDNDDSIKTFFKLQKLYEEYTENRNEILNFIRNLLGEGENINSIQIEITDQGVVLSSDNIQQPLSLALKPGIRDFFENLDFNILNAVDDLKSKEQIDEIETEFYKIFFEFLFETIKSFIKEIVSVITYFEEVIKKNLLNDFKIFKEKLEFIKLFLAKATNLSELKKDLGFIEKEIRKVVEKIYEKFENIKNQYARIPPPNNPIRQNLANSFSDITQYYKFFIYFLYDDIGEKLQRITEEMGLRIPFNQVYINNFLAELQLQRQQRNRVNNIDKINIFRKIHLVISLIDDLPNNLKIIYNTLAERERFVNIEAKALIETKVNEIDFENLVNYQRSGISFLEELVDERLKNFLVSKLQQLRNNYYIPVFQPPAGQAGPVGVAPQQQPPSASSASSASSLPSIPLLTSSPSSEPPPPSTKKENKNLASSSISSSISVSDMKVKTEHEKSVNISDLLENNKSTKGDCGIKKDPSKGNSEYLNLRKIYEIMIKENDDDTYSIDFQNIKAFGNSDFNNVLFLVKNYEKLKNYENGKFTLPQGLLEKLKDQKIFEDNNTYMYISENSSEEDFKKILEKIKGRGIDKVHYVTDIYDDLIFKIGVENIFKIKSYMINFFIPVSEYDKAFAVCILNELIKIHQSINSSQKKDYEYILGDDLFKKLQS